MFDEFWECLVAQTMKRVEFFISKHNKIFHTIADGEMDESPTRKMTFHMSMFLSKAKKKSD